MGILQCVYNVSKPLSRGDVKELGDHIMGNVFASELGEIAQLTEFMKCIISSFHIRLFLYIISLLTPSPVMVASD